MLGWDDDNSHFGAFGCFCDAHTRGVVVFDEVAWADG